jgi:solute carrier family 5 (sodium-dependent multivitamin transporter), member 6
VATADWVVLGVYLVGIVAFGMWTGRGSKGMDEFFLAGRTMRWWAIGLSVMATQISAITFVGTTGQAYTDGMRFLVVYFGLPTAMVVICATLVPFFYRARVFTAYEYLEKRFDARTRTLTSLLFLCGRGLSVGVTLYAPSLVLAVILGWSENTTILVMGLSTIVYVVYGGNRSVIWTDVVQMALIWFGIFLCVGLAVARLPEQVSLRDALAVAQAAGRLEVMDTSTSLQKPYTLWSGLIGGFFLQLSYFGADQSQVGRILTARTARGGKLGLLFNGLVKVPMQFFILLLGVLVFVAYRFEPAPVFFNPAEAARAAAGPHGEAWREAEQAWDSARSELARSLRAETEARRAGDAVAARDAHARALAADVAANAARSRAVAAIQATAPDANPNDTNYIFLRYVLTHLPVGVVGLVLAAIFAAAMNSSMSELNALASTTVVDVVQRLQWASGERALLTWSRFATLFWVVFAVGFAQFAGRLGSLVEAVNIMGSLFYGTILGIFLTALFVKRAGGNAVFIAALLGEAAVIACWQLTPLSFLWWNLIGCVLTVGVAAGLSTLNRGDHQSASAG